MNESKAVTQVNTQSHAELIAFMIIIQLVFLNWVFSILSVFLSFFSFYTVSFKEINQDVVFQSLLSEVLLQCSVFLPSFICQQLQTTNKFEKKKKPTKPKDVISINIASWAAPLTVQFYCQCLCHTIMFLKAFRSHVSKGVKSQLTVQWLDCKTRISPFSVICVFRHASKDFRQFYINSIA